MRTFCGIEWIKAYFCFPLSSAASVLVQDMNSWLTVLGLSVQKNRRMVSVADIAVAAVLEGGDSGPRHKSFTLSGVTGSPSFHCEECGSSLPPAPARRIVSHCAN